MGGMNKDTADKVLLVTRNIVATKGFTCTLRELANAAEVPYPKAQKTWLNADNLYRETEKHLYKELSSYLGKCRKDEAITPLLVKIWFSLRSVTNGRKFLLQKVLSGEASGITNNPIVTRLIKACETSKSNYEADPNVMAASLYLIAINSDPKTLTTICEDFKVPCLPEELSVKYLNEVAKMFGVGDREQQ